MKNFFKNVYESGIEQKLFNKEKIKQKIKQKDERFVPVKSSLNKEIEKEGQEYIEKLE